MWVAYSGPYRLTGTSESLLQLRGLTGLLMLGSTPLILFAVYFSPKLNSNFIPEEIKLRISCISSYLYHVWCHLTVDKNLTFSFRPVLPTTGPGNKVNSRSITSCIVMLIMTAANILSCKETLVCCCERWVNTIKDCTAETWVDYCQLDEDRSLSPEILKLQCSWCLKFCVCGTLLHAQGPSSSFLMGSGQWTAQNYRHASGSSPYTTELIPENYQLFVYCRYTTNHRYLELKFAFFNFLEDEISKQEAMSRTHTA